MDFPYKIYTLGDEKYLDGKVGWRCPSNIAIVKYWGKYGIQMPRNASFSFTLSNAHTDTYITYSKQPNGKVSLDFMFEGKENQAFADKITKFLHSISEYIPIVKDFHFKIESSNSFPHSSGIASSASSMGALALCICSIEAELFGISHDEELRQKASYLARLGSGSASRSLMPYFSTWGEHPKINGSSNLYATRTEGLHSIFQTFHDDILIVSAKEKSVSSTAGHALMENNVYAPARYAQANQRVEDLLEIMKTDNVDAFGKIAEDEAMTLHALMMCSDPSYILIEPGTLQMIKEIRSFRDRTKLPIYFTLDAGPNIHLLYPASVKGDAEILINDYLLPFTENNVVIKDKISNGPKRLL
ncbi:MAG: diphosphomevalonate decarboxylase [Saprospiraceae bacterium]|nr:diphosphomevalonate decarboxylase [Saprospiraceae bacterium]